MKKHKIGAAAGIFEILHTGHLSIFKEAKQLCEKLIVGVKPSGLGIIPLSERVEVLKSLVFVDEVVIMEKDTDYIAALWEAVKFDCFFTAENKKTDPETIKAIDFLIERGADVIFLPYIKDKNIEEMRAKAKDNLILAFGTGIRFDKYIEQRGLKNQNVIAFDNDPNKWGTEKHGVPIKPPEEIPEYVKKGGRVLITCAKQEEIMTQLEKMGISEYYVSW